MKNALKMFLSGIGMGIANVIPGLSGGTILVLTGAFEPLTNSIATVAKIKNDHRKTDILIILELVLGLAIGILSFSVLVPYISSFAFPQLMAFFIGIIAVSSYLFYKKEIKEVKSIKPIPLITGFLICFLMIIFVNDPGNVGVAYNENPSILFLLQLTLLGAIAGATMIFPGISGSLVLFIFGMYYVVWGYVKETLVQLIHLEFYWYMILPLFFVAIGILVGIIGGSWVSKKLLSKYRLVTINLILGLVIGGACALFPIGKNVPSDVSITWNFITISSTILCLFVGAAIVYALEKLATKKQDNKSIE